MAAATCSKKPFILRSCLIASTHEVGERLPPDGPGGVGIPAKLLATPGRCVTLIVPCSKSKKHMPFRNEKKGRNRMRVHHLNNVSRALAILEDNNVKLVNISNEHIVDGSAKLTLGLVWAIILHWQVQGVLKDVMSDLQQTNLEKTLLAWCRQTTKGYHGVDVQNFTTSWTDGLAFNALIHSHRPHLFDWTVLARKHPYARLENAFRVAHEHLSIERLLDPEDVNSQVPDKKSIMMM
ncbi:utrophin-like [Macrobrachium nipponense]|uniref:utrophin-like n=1 Tax=Macrobrachium nipponense TaxID=159736 RepID=UPI0030C83421